MIFILILKCLGKFVVKYGRYLSGISPEPDNHIKDIYGFLGGEITNIPFFLSLSIETLFLC